MGRKTVRQFWDTIGVEAVIIFIAFMLFLLFMKVRGYILEEVEFEKRMYQSCLESGEIEDACKKMLLDDLWSD